MSAKHTFEDVVEALRLERQYQKAKWGVNNESMDPIEITKPTESYLVYMIHHLRQAISSISSTPNDEKAIEHVHKVTALGIKCMQDNGMFFRPDSTVRNRRNGVEYDFSKFDING